MLQISSALAKGMFCRGNILDVAEVFSRFLQKPEIRHLALTGCPSNQNEKYQRSITGIVENINKYLTTILATKGSRQTLDQQAYRTVLAACAGPNLKQQHLMKETGRVLV